MTKSKDDAGGRQPTSKQTKSQIDQFTAKLKEYESQHDSLRDCSLVNDGLRLSQEVEILRRQNELLRRENAALKKQLAGSKPHTSSHRSIMPSGSAETDA